MELKLHLLGGLSMTVGGGEPVHFAAVRAELCVAYLALHPTPHGREQLADFLWDDRPRKQALSNLRSLLAQLPEAIKPYITADRQTISITPTLPVWVDARAFAATASTTHTPAELSAALHLYQGDFLEGVFVRESRGLEEWSALWRERLQRQALQAHLHLAQHHLHHRQYELGIRHGRHALRLDPFNEAAVRFLMLLLSRAGQRNAALQQYNTYAKLLAQEMDTTPADETIHLYDRIRLVRDPIPHHLPLQPTPFIGRETELATLASRLDDPTARLITIVGLGGNGKTRLAIQAADERRGDYLHGIYFVSLLGIPTADQLPTALATQLNIPLQHGAPATEQLLHQLAEREMLLILDNFEQIVLEGAAMVGQILAAAPHVRLLITSREALNLPQEQLLQLGGLAIETAAVALFTQCAQRHVAPLPPTAATTSAIQRICRYVDGSPLAIELVAAALPQQEITHIAAEIETTLAELTTRLRDVPLRHRSMQATFDYSWNLLPPAGQNALAALAIFHQSFDAPTAAHITATTPAQLTELVGKAFVQQQGQLYTLPALVRQYAHGRLAETGRTAGLQAAHGRYHLQLLANQETALETAELPAALQIITPRLEEIRAAWQWAITHGQLAELDAALDSLGLFLEAKGWASIGLVLLQGTLDQLPHAPAPLRGRLRAWLGHCQERTALMAESRANLQAAWDLLTAGTAEPPLAAARPQKQLGTLTYAQGLHETAEHHFRAALAIYEAHGLPPAAAACLNELAHLKLATGEIAECEALSERALVLCRQTGNQRDTAIALSGLGKVAEQRGDHQHAYTIAHDNLLLCEQLGDLSGMAYAHHWLGNLGRRQGALATAESHYRAGLALAEQLGDPWWRALFAVRLGNLAEEQRQYAEAQALYHKARHLCHQIGDQRGLAITEFHLGTTAAALGHEQSAFAHLLHSLETAATIQFMPMVLESLLRLAQREHQQWPPDLLAHVVAFVATHPATDKAWEPHLVALAAGLPPVAAPSDLAALVTAVRRGSF